jgi:hypothetical protein
MLFLVARLHGRPFAVLQFFRIDAVHWHDEIRD